MRRTIARAFACGALPAALFIVMLIWDHESTTAQMPELHAMNKKRAVATCCCAGEVRKREPETSASYCSSRSAHGWRGCWRGVAWRGVAWPALAASEARAAEFCSARTAFNLEASPQNTRGVLAAAAHLCRFASHPAEQLTSQPRIVNLTGNVMTRDVTVTNQSLVRATMNLESLDGGSDARSRRSRRSRRGRRRTRTARRPGAGRKSA